MNKQFTLNGKVIETERLTLRPFCENDLDDFFEYASVEGVGEMAGWQHHADKQVSQTILHSFIDEDKTFAVCLKPSGKVIGSLGIEFYDMENELTEIDRYYGREIGYVLGNAYWGRGLMPEAVKAVIEYLFGECDLDFITCGYFINNTQSKRVQEKCGFKPYRRILYQTRMGTKEPTILNLLINPKKDIRIEFPPPETFNN